MPKSRLQATVEVPQPLVARMWHEVLKELRQNYKNIPGYRAEDTVSPTRVNSECVVWAFQCLHNTVMGRAHAECACSESLVHRASRRLFDFILSLEMPHFSLCLCSVPLGRCDPFKLAVLCCRFQSTS